MDQILILLTVWKTKKQQQILSIKRCNNAFITLRHQNQIWKIIKNEHFIDNWIEINYPSKEKKIIGKIMTKKIITIARNFCAVMKKNTSCLCFRT